MPIANIAPTKAPMLTPPTRSISIPAAVSSSSTPMWEKARAPPPESTTPTELPVRRRAIRPTSSSALPRRTAWVSSGSIAAAQAERAPEPSATSQATRSQPRSSARAPSAGGAPPAEGARAELRGCDLVAWEVAEGSGALSAWAAAIDPLETHAVRRGSADDDVGRIARRLTGNSVGVVLSGGGARAFSHIGVLEELTAAGIEIDRVGGVSMGAFVGAMFAMGMDLEEIDARCYEEWVRRRPLGDYTLPRHSLIRGERSRAMLERTFGSASIEELGRSFFSGATELRSGELVVIRSGLL